MLLVGSYSAAWAAAPVPVGASKIDITPETPVRMYGYGARKTESEGVAGRLKASALAIGGDEGEGPAVLLCVDCGAVPPDVREAVLEALQADLPLARRRFMLCNSHNHSGPNLKGMGSISGGEHERLARYKEELTRRLEEVVRQALAARTPGHLAWAKGSVGFAANRRVLTDGKWSGFGAVPEAPADHSLPVMRVTDTEGKLLAVVVNYACHCTTLRGNFKQIHGDWAACAQDYIEAEAPDAVTLVTIGCGADSDPCPHGTVALCEQHGRALADEVKRVLSGPMEPIEPKLVARLAPLEIPYAELPPKEELEAAAKESRAASRLLERLARGERPPRKRTFQVATWTFGDDLAMVFLSDEVVVDYALRMKRELDGRRLWIAAYTADVSNYVVSRRLIEEGGYEVRNSISSAISHGRSDQVDPPIEDRIVQRVRELLPEDFRTPSAE